MKRLSIIVPVYKVEQYVRTCVESIFRQGLNEDDFEVILVNDGTPDHSFERIADIISSHSNIIVLEQENQGLSVARNRGLNFATGQFVLFLDSDDLLVELSLSDILEAAYQHTPDLIVGDFKKQTDDEILNSISQQQTKATFEVLTGESLFLQYLNPRECYVWRTIYRRDYLEKEHLRFIPGIYFEDVPFTTECYMKASKCLRTTHMFYIYRQHKNSICSSIDIRKIYDLNTVISHLWTTRQNLQLCTSIHQKMTDVIFIIFSLTQWYICQHDNLFKVRKQLTNDLKKKVPHLKFNNTFKQKIISFLYCKMPNQYLWIKRAIG